jgi:hypothetical protein
MIRNTRLQGAARAGLLAVTLVLVTGGFSHFAATQDTPPAQAARKVEAKKPDYSPYPDQKFPNRVCCGDAHGGRSLRAPRPMDLDLDFSESENDAEEPRCKFTVQNGAKQSNKTGLSMIEHGEQSRQGVERFGGASRARTDDLIVANDALSQLSYSPTVWNCEGTP